MFYFPRFSADPKYGPDEGARLIIPLRRCRGLRLAPADLVRFVMAINSGKLLQPATVQLLQQNSERRRARRPVQSWMGPRDRPCGGDKRAWSAMTAS